MLGGVWAFYFLIRKVFASEKIALMSSCFAFQRTPWLYYSFESALAECAGHFFVFWLVLSFLVYAKKR